MPLLPADGNVPVPPAGDIGRHDPEVDVPPVVERRRDLDRLVGLPVAHLEAVRDEARARPELGQELGPEAQVDRGQEIHGDDRGIAEIRFEEVLLEEPDLAREPGRGRVVVALGDPDRIDVDAHGLDPEPLGRRDDDAAVTAAEVVEDIPRLDPGQAQHHVDDLRRGGHIGHVVAPELRPGQLLGDGRLRKSEQSRQSGDGEDRHRVLIAALLERGEAPG